MLKAVANEETRSMLEKRLNKMIVRTKIQLIQKMEKLTAVPFRVLDYTYITRSDQTPTGLLLRPWHSDGAIELFHTAVQHGYVPPINSKIILVVPEKSKLMQYNDRKYYSTVLGYIEEDI